MNFSKLKLVFIIGLFVCSATIKAADKKMPNILKADELDEENARAVIKKQSTVHEKLDFYKNNDDK